MTTQKLDTSVRAIRHWLARSVKSLGNHSDRLNAINVFPVADGDTGSNLYLTARAGHDAVSKLESDDIGGFLEIAARAAMESARGNSGTLLAVFLSGLSEPWQGQARLTAPLLALGLERAKVRSWSALSEPVEGTMLSVINALALAAASTLMHLKVDRDSRAALDTLLTQMTQAARLAVKGTESELPSLVKAGVVDAGAVGMLVIIDELCAAIRNEHTDFDDYDGFHGYSVQDPHVHFDFEEIDGVEVMCTVALDALGAATLRGQLDALGDSVIMSPVNQLEDDTYRWRVHVHVEDPEAALDLIRKQGNPVNVSVTDLCIHDG
ncbi:DAK2 domain-containing protein [Glutamicibacter protophormiae]|uniref:DAK2 domain-containing protein n=1 Tax=Glutamicibacter protophormiae TaxID=37930 RepID=UPI002A7FDE6D|nr:DAK2 domain-containing protein [Glutamicibacter protophormiae]WPR66166.1 DAK2 domain-containing protein [Glutamicibacter protophormiae]WPR69662.1 DAK2 domain-containing protein [Glutamicibacter protophormiae]